MSGQQKNEKIADALTIIHRRKSVRHYIDKPVTEEQLITLLKAGMAAPVGMGVRPWFFVAITKREQLDRLADVHPYAQMLRGAAAAIVVCGDTQTKLPAGYWVQVCAAATENILLAAEAIGLGAVWTGVYLDEKMENDVRDVLSIPKEIIPFNIIPIGWPTGEDKPKDKYEPDKIHWEKW